MEATLTKENENDIFKCDACGKKTTRKDIRKIWKSIPFGNEEKQSYYCGCFGWD